VAALAQLYVGRERQRTRAETRDGASAIRSLPATSAAARVASGTSGSIAAPPGAIPYPPELQQRLRAALAAESGAPRTRHRADDGSPLYTNRLVLEPSPYLQQHAHNPVDWYPWTGLCACCCRYGLGS